MHDKLKAQAQQNVQAQEQKAEEKMLKYLLRALKGLHQRLIILDQTKAFKMQLFTSSSPGNALWHHEFLQNTNSHWRLIELAVN